MDGDYHVISYTIHYVNTMNQQPTMMRDCPCHSVFDIAEALPRPRLWQQTLWDALPNATQDLWNMLDPSAGGYEGAV